MICIHIISEAGNLILKAAQLSKNEKHLQTCSVLVTEDRALAEIYHRNGGCVIGVSETENAGALFFENADAAVLSFDAITEAFLRLTACHKLGIPYCVARDRELVIRESVSSDHRAVCDMLLDCRDDAFSGGLTPEEAKDRRNFEAYISAAYAFFGYGLWTVILDRRYRPAPDPGGLRERENKAGRDNGGREEDIIGWCGLFMTPQEESDGRFPVELGYLIRHDMRRKEYGFRACRLICDYARDELGVTGLGLCVARDNKASRKLAGRLGFKNMGGGEILYYEKEFRSAPAPDS